MINSKYAVGGIATVEDTSSAMSLQAVLVQSVTDTFMTIFMDMYCACTVCMHKKRVSGVSRTHFRASKISKNFLAVCPRPPSVRGLPTVPDTLK